MAPPRGLIMSAARLVCESSTLLLFLILSVAAPPSFRSSMLDCIRSAVRHDGSSSNGKVIAQIINAVVNGCTVATLCSNLT